VIEHLVVSTLVLASAMLATRVIPMTARTRYAVILCGILKFAVPTAVFDFVPVEAVPRTFRVFAGGAAAPVVEPQTQIEWMPIAWAIVATLLFARWLLLRQRTIDAALASTSAASQRELDALQRINKNIALVRSPLCVAPAVLRVFRPVIVLPAHGCDELDDDELRALLLHECAHVARRDNLAAIAQAAATSLLWFHPVVWFASRALTSAREEACDETVAECMRESDSFLSALGKICHAIAAPRTAGASCMAGSSVKERMEHLMSYTSIRKKAWPHRAIVIAAAFAIALTTVAATRTEPSPYAFSYTVHSGVPGELTFHVSVREGSKEHFEGDLGARANQTATLRLSVDDDPRKPEFLVRVNGTAQKGEVKFTATENGLVVMEKVETYDLTRVKVSADAPMSLRLKDASFRDFLQSSAEMMGYDITIDPSAEKSRISLDVENMPFEQVLEKIANDNGLTITIQGKSIHVTKK
jgi:beta-lactamase regulating signal transducer with metallopeptidase domain